MIVAAHQPAYLPWLGYLDKIALADVFVYLDTVQFEKNSFINRNRIKTAQGVQWLTIPVKIGGHTSATMRDTQIANDEHWRDKHLKAIALNYRRARHFDTCFPRFAGQCAVDEPLLVEYCWRQLAFWLHEFEIETRVIRASEMALEGTKSELILDLCRKLGADEYLSGVQGRNYLKFADFESAGIKVRVQEFIGPTYPQLWGDFVPNLSLLDFWMNEGPGALPRADRQ